MQKLGNSADDEDKYWKYSNNSNEEDNGFQYIENVMKFWNQMPVVAYKSHLQLIDFQCH